MNNNILKGDSDEEHYFSAKEYYKSQGHTSSSSPPEHSMTHRWRSITGKAGLTGEGEEDESLLEAERMTMLESGIEDTCTVTDKFYSLLDCTTQQSHWMNKISDDTFLEMEKLVIHSPELQHKIRPNLSAIPEATNELSSKVFHSIQSSGTEEESNTETSAADYVTSDSRLSSGNENEVQQNLEDESIKFNDTLEEMDYILTHGMNFKIKNHEPETPKPNSSSVRVCTPPTVVSKPKTVLKKRIFFEGSPRNDKENVEVQPRKVFFYPPSPQVKPLASIRSNFDNVLSPIKYFIDNSPIAPQIRNVQPTKPIIDKHYPNDLDKTNVMDCKSKMSSVLPPKTYTSSAIAHVINEDPITKLPKNGKVSAMMENLPKTTVIKHERPDNLLTPDRTPFGKRFADNHANISLHVKSPATRTNTLK